MIVTATYMEHESGTKFYEVIELNNAILGRHCVVRRWGKIDQAKDGGGQIKLEKFEDARRSHAASQNIRNDKERRGYSNVRSNFGLHDADSVAGSISVSDIGRHYKDREFTEEIANYMGIGVTEEITSREADDVVIEEPTTVDRGDEWGSW